MAETNKNGLNAETYGLKFAIEELREQAMPLFSKTKASTPTEPERQNGSAGNGKVVPDSQNCALSKECFALASTVKKILEHLDDSVIREQRRAEWRMLGALIDRMLLIVLTLVVVLTTIYMYAIAPALYTQNNINY